MAVQLPVLPETEQLSTNVIRILGGNPSKYTLQGTNTYLLGRGPSRILVDTAQGLPQWSKQLSAVLKEQSATVSTCLLTHWHHDGELHVSGVNDLLKISQDAKVYKNTPTLNPDSILDVSSLFPITDGQTFSASDFEITAVHSPGHAADHMCFLVTRSPDQSEIGSLFTADNVLGHGTAVFENLHVYMQSLALMKSKIGAGRRAYPGHGAVIEDGAGKIEEYIQHRRMREEEALNVLRYGRVTKPGDEEAVREQKEWESMEMVKVIYAQYPENLWEPAEIGLKQVLEKLKGEGRVVTTAAGRWRVSEKATL